MTIAMFSQVTSADLVSLDCVSVLPLKAEPMSTWSPRGDLADFLKKLCDIDSVMLDEKGEEHHVNYASYGQDLYAEGQKEFALRAKEFGERAREAVSAPASVNPSPLGSLEFSHDEHFGLMAKYAIAWSGTVNAILSEGAFCSLAHALESEDNARCSILLASNMYFRQAKQVLRNVIEDVLAQLHFCWHEASFADWREGKQKMAALRGRKGLIRKLVDASVLPENLATEATRLYGELCADVHGEESRLVNTGLFTRDWTGRPFRYDRFKEWCKTFASTLDLSIQLQRVATNCWIDARPGEPFCSVCHSSGRWEQRQETEFGGRRHIELTCPDCGNSMTLAAETLTSS